MDEADEMAVSQGRVAIWLAIEQTQALVVLDWREPDATEALR